ncbi:MAG TPA: hypothetical protein VHE13_13900 [Opitutus sp.]|nr:hypothetical protein [Opitutus sp.]
MAARGRLGELGGRKQVLVARADLHRQLFALERDRLLGRWMEATSLVGRHRWWLVGGAAVAGVLLVRRWRSLVAVAPTVFSVWRALRP